MLSTLQYGQGYEIETKLKTYRVVEAENKSSELNRDQLLHVAATAKRMFFFCVKALSFSLP